ncbi:MAG: hypothetical protein LDL15_02360 [Yonghaparkia sp.]|nr:hypothetical protein [Microcella sp.]
MNTITRAVTTAQHPPSPADIPPRSRPVARRVGLVDRIALRLGVALVAWSRRPRLLDDRAERERRAQLERSTALRERQWQRETLLLLPPR